MLKTVFLTGGTGFIGANLIANLLGERKCERVIALVRASSRQEARQRLLPTIEKVQPALIGSVQEGRLIPLPGNICQPDLGLSRPDILSIISDTTHLIHSAGNVDFDTPLDEARRVNVEGTRNVLTLASHARRQGRLQRVGYIGTAYVSGSRRGVIREAELRDAGFSNAYERSKFEAEQVVRRAAQLLPTVILRPSIVVGDSSTGVTTSFNVLYPPLEWIRRRRVSALPGFRATPVDIVPVDYVVRAISHLVLDSPHAGGQTFHIAAGREGTWTAGEVIDYAVEYFNRLSDPCRIPRVRFIPPMMYRLLLRQLSSAGERLQKLIALYEPYLTVTRRFDTSNTTRELSPSGIIPPRLSEYFDRILDYCIETNWGRTRLRTVS